MASIKEQLDKVKAGLDAHNSDLSDPDRCRKCPYQRMDGSNACMENLLLDAEAHIWILEGKLALTNSRNAYLETMFDLAKVGAKAGAGK